ncbi:hypothetical protein [Halalkalibacterium halodurans]|uniref:Uncharacterized protein n=1 Tax=Halalkalibacterium halodurans TaxID=86665 RepID=A0A0M0KMG3_ALKHA|nr:hypothetical protein [Halalkalibacterium halodurans]TPE67340.1 hypothetical protein AMD02_017355 [Halalkalibacterium halodurans]
MSTTKMYGFVLIGLALLFSALVIMLAILSQAVEKTTPSHYVHWIHYIDPLVYVCVFVPLGIGIYLLVKKDG